MGCYKVILDCAEANVVFYEKCGLTRKEIQMVRDSVNASCPPFRSRMGMDTGTCSVISTALLTSRCTAPHPQVKYLDR